MTWFRFHHLAFGAAVLAAWFTAESTGIAHAWIGYAAATMLLLRLVLGIVRRKGFELRRLRPSLATPPHGQTGLRHPAIGRTLSLALFLAVAATAGTGIAMDRGGTLVGQSIRTEHEGEEYDEREDSEERGVRGQDEQRSEEGDHEDEGVLAEVHETLGNLILPLVGLHLLYMLLLRHDLARFMLFLPARRRRPRAQTA